MSDIYDQLLDQGNTTTEPTAPTLQAPPSGDQPARQPDAYDTLLDGYQAAQKQRLQSSITQAVGTTPERTATAQSLAKATGLPEDVVERNFDAVAQQVRARELQSLLADSPILSRQMADPNFAKLAHDDYEPLSLIERIPRQFAGGAVELAGRTLSGTGQAMNILQRNILQGIAGLVLPEPMAGGSPTPESLVGNLAGQDLVKVGSDIKDYAQSDIMIPQQRQTFTDQVAAGLGQVGAQVLLHVLSGGLLNYPTMFTQGVDIMADKTAKDDASQGNKDLAMVGGGLVTALTEKWALDRILGPLSVPVKNAVGAALLRVGIAGASEGAQELTEGVIHDVMRKALTNRDAEIDIPGAYEEGQVGFAVGAIVRGIVESALRVRVRHQRLEQNAQEAEQNAAVIEQLNQAAAVSKLREISPESFEQFIEAATQDGPVQGVYIDAGMLMQSGIAQDLAQVSPSIAAQVEEAAALGESVRIPIAEYAARIAPTEHAAALLDHLKTNPDGFSRAEAQAYMQTQAEQLEAEVEQRIAQMGGQNEFRESQQRVKDLVLGELNALNRFTEGKNELDATLIAARTAVRAAQLGITPEQLFERQRLRFAAENIAGDTFDQQGNLQTDTPAFREWFGDSKVVDDTGAPLVVYHGTKSDVTEFQLGKAKRRDAGWFGDGFYLSGSSELASSYAMREADHSITERPANVMPLYVKLENPYRIDLSQLSYDEGSNFTKKFGGNDGFKQWLSENGYDGVIGFRDPEIAGEGAQHWEVVVFEPSQIKSATGNRGTFDANDPNILHQSQNEAGTAQIFDTEGEFKTLQDLVDGVNDGRLLVHARVPDGTDFAYGIDPSAGEFLRSTESWQWAEEEYGQGPELTFFADSFDWATSDILREVRSAQDAGLELVFVRKDENIQMSMGGDRVRLADGTEVSYELSPVADFEDPIFASEPAGVESGDWYTKETQEVVAVAPADEILAQAQRPQFNPNDPNILHQDGRADLATDTPAFKRWFGDSKVVDADGKPLVVYHGTTADFTEFDPTGGNTPGSWFTTDASAAQSFGDPMAVYVTINNPGELADLAAARRSAAREFDPMEQGREFNEAVARQLESAGFDGVHAENFQGAGGREVWMALRPEQIKSATGNAGTFDPNDPNILYQSQDEPRNLFVAHNLSAENILAAQDLGGLAAPSIAIGRSDIGFDSFGEVTLLADPSLLEDRTIRTFDADIYSPRQPRAHYDLDTKAYYAFEQSLDPDRLGLSKPDINEVSGTDGADALLRSDAVRLKFLQERGQAPRLRNAKVEPAVRKAAKLEGNRYDLIQNPKLIKIATDFYRDKVDRARAADDARGDRYEGFFFEADGSIMDDAVRKFADMVQRFKDTNGKDVNRLRDDLRDKFTQKKRADEYAQWVTDQFNRMVKGKTLFKGFTNAGNRRYIPYTMDNVVREMTQQLQAGEGSFYGAGTVRSAYANEMRTLDQIRQRRGQIVSEAEFKTLRDESNQVLQDTLEKLKPHYKFDADSWNYSEDAGSAIAEGPKGLREAFDVTPEVQQIVADLVEYLQAMPTTYFEAKARRAMQFSEFDTAVVPKGMRKDALQVLRDAGLKIKTYDPKVEGSRNQVVAGQERLLFQNQRAPRGAFSPDTNTIALLKNADLSTFLHEAGHYFFESDIALASDIVKENRLFGDGTAKEGEQQILTDVSTLLDWHGIKGDISTQLATWHNLGFEEKRSYHERTAESFERYLFEGVAPSIELQSYFQQFRAWLLNVYRSMKDFLARNTDAGQLNDEVRAVFDRMLATNDDIALAEQGRSMMPLFRTQADAENAGMTPEEFAAYQAQDPQASNDAVQDLQAKGLRDLQWVRNAHNREVKKLQRQAAGLRREARIEARREIMSQPVYQAWAFLTRKLESSDRLATQRPKADPNVLDPEMDSLLVAVAKLGGIRKADVVAEWGVDPAERPASGIFGKPVLRATEGHGIDDMRQMLVEYGYLDGNYTDPSWNPNEFEERFDSELRGDLQYSNQVSAEALMGDGPLAGEGTDIATLAGGRLDLPSLREMGFSEDQINVLKARRMTASEGLHPDLVSEMPGVEMSSGDELVRALLEADPPQDAIEALTDTRMLEQHGELATPDAIEREADRAIHNETRARMVATEANALARATGQRRILAAAAKQFAQAMVSRVKVRNIQPSVYANAAARAGKAAEKASRAGDIAQAGADKRTQLVNIYATRAAHDVRTEVDKNVRYLNRFNADGARRGLDADYLEQIDTLLDRFDLRRGQSLRSIDKRKALAQWVSEQELAGLEPDIPDYLLHEANRTHYKDLTVEEFRGLVETVRQIEHLGRLKKKLLTAKDQRELDAIVEEITARIIESSDGREVDNEKRATFESQATHFGRRWMAIHRKAASVVREMDGFEEGGPMWEYFIRSMNEAGDKEADMRAKAAKRLHEMSKPVLSGEAMGGKGRYFPTLKRSFNRGERLALALNWGNDGNRQRMLGGRNWTADQVQPVLGSLSASDWQFVQNVWDFFESYRPEIGAKERRVYGKEPDWIEPVAFEIRTSDGQTLQLRGGYYPIKYDPNQSGKAAEFAEAEDAKALMRAAHTAATTRRSFTKTRAEEVHGRPVLLTFDGIWQGANELIHDLSWHEWAIDANRLMKRLDDPIRNHYGAQYVEVLRSSLKDSVRGDTDPTNMLERSLNHVRIGSTVVGLGWNLTTAMLQPLGLSQSFVRVGGKWIMKGLSEFYGSPLHMAEKAREVRAMSPLMENRALTMNREINDVRNRLESSSDFKLKMEATFFLLIQKLQAGVDYPTWLGAYEKAMADPKNDEARAIALADQAVIDSQSGGQIKDLAQVQRGHPLLKLFTNFYSYFNVVMNLTTEQTKKRMKRKEYAGLAGDYLLIMVLPAILSGVLRQALKGQDDEDEYIESVLGELIGYPLGMFVGVRELSGVASKIAGIDTQFSYSGPAGLRFFSEMDKLGQQIGQGEADKALFKSLNNVGGLLFHYPAGQVNRMIDGSIHLLEGKTRNPGVLLSGIPY
ncbi:hypothetical protein H0A64_09965 [Alcaligenaceae bacterium]|nr:hypothetical protein [Alcaligenaceae bacterium]